MSLKGLKGPVSKFVSSDTCPRPTTALDSKEATEATKQTYLASLGGFLDHGDPRARSHYRFVPPFIHFTPDSRRESVHIF
jgi:hypothetical protein